MLTALLFCFFSQASAHPQDSVCREQGDKIVCSNGTLDHINLLSDVIFHGTTITGHTKIMGDVNADHAHFTTIDIIGDVRSDNTTVTGAAKLVGDLHCDHCLFQDRVNVTGDTKIANTQFLQQTQMIGDVTGDNSQFEGDLKLSTTTAILSHTNTKNIEFTPSKQSQALYLRGTTVDGNITFSTNNGVVYCSGDSIIHGTVSGGKLVNQS